MSSILGILSQEDEPIQSKVLTVLQQGILQGKEDAWQHFVKGTVGFAQHSVETFSAIRSNDLAVTTHRNLAIVALGRLDNRQDLLDALHIQTEQHSQLCNQMLVLLAYAQWGQECVHHFYGDWAFALWDDDHRRLLLARDQCGRTELFYFLDPSTNCLIFASSLKALLSVSSGPPQLNLAHIAQYAQSVPRSASTPYWGIERLQPGYRLIADEKGIDVRQYWSVYDVADVRLKSDDAYVETFTALFTDAVRTALAGPQTTGAFLSGGLDSGSVATLAARQLASREESLPTFSAVPLFDTLASTPRGRHGDERQQIERVVVCSGNMNPIYIKNNQISPLAAIESMLKILDEPFVHAANTNWLQAIFQAAQQQGIGVLLSGEGGNLTLSYAGNHTETTGSLRQQKHWTQLLTTQVAESWRTGLHFASRLNDPDAWQKLGLRIQGVREPSPMPSPIRREFVDEVITTDSSSSRQQSKSKERAPEQTRVMDTYLRQSIFTRGWNWAGAWGLEIRDPTMDRRLVEFCLGIPREQYYRGRQSRLLVRRAMAGQLPAEVLWNRQRGLQSADVVHQVRASRGEIEEALRRIEASPLVQHCLDIPAMRSVLDGIEHKLDYRTTFAVMGLLLRGLQIGLFLLRFDK